MSRPNSLAAAGQSSVEEPIMSIVVLCCIALLCCVGAALASEQKSLYLYEEDIDASEPLRVQQARELEHYTTSMRDDPAALRALFNPNFTTAESYERSTR